MLLFHVLSVISHLSLVTTQSCSLSGAYGCNTTSIDDFQASCDATSLDDVQASCDATSLDDVQASCGCILKNCPGGFPASNDCIQDWCCNKCADPDNCCGPEVGDPMSCFQSSYNRSDDLAQCNYIASRGYSCSSATTGFATLSFTDQVSCLCSDENGVYDGYSWDNAATTCYTAIESQTTLATSDLDDYYINYVGVCTDFATTSRLSNTITSSERVSTTATPAVSSSLSGPTTGTGTSGGSSGVTAGTPPPATTAGTPSASRTSSGAVKGLQGRGMIPGSLFLVICCIFASL